MSKEICAKLLTVPVKMTSKRNYCKNKILFRNLAKFLIPKLTRFKTLILLLYPSIKPLDKLVLTILVISVIQYMYLIHILDYSLYH